MKLTVYELFDLFLPPAMLLVILFDCDIYS